MNELSYSLAGRKINILSYGSWSLPKVPWLAHEITEPFGQVLTERICSVLIMHNKKEIWDRTSSTARWMALKTEFHRLVHFIISVNSLGRCLACIWYFINSGGSCDWSGN